MDVCGTRSGGPLVVIGKASLPNVPTTIEGESGGSVENTATTISDEEAKSKERPLGISRILTVKVAVV